MKKIALVGALAALVVGCSSTDTVEGVQSFAQCTFPDSPQVEAPAWICDVMPKDIAIGAQGYAKKSVAGMSVMKKVAINNARAAMASTFETDVSNMFRQALSGKTNTTTADGSDEAVVEAFEDVTKNITNRTLTNSRVLVSQVSPAGGLYVLVGMDQKTYDENVARIVTAASAEDSEMRKSFTNKKVEESLLKALESMTK